MNDEKRIYVAARCLKLARALIGEDEMADEKDEQFAARIRTLKPLMNKLAQKKRRKLSQYGIGVIRANGTVEDLVSALELVLAEA